MLPLRRTPAVRPARLAVIALLLVVVVVNVVVTHDWLTAPYPGHNDFLPRWEGARAYWLEGVPVYSEQSTRQIQQRMYGRPAEAGEDPAYFAYPFYTVFITWPLVHLPYDWATGIWMVVLEICLLGTLGLLLRIYRWKPRPPALGLLCLGTLLFYPSFRGLILGQFSHAVLFTQVLAIWALIDGRDRLAGATLALTTLKPQMAYLLIPALLAWAVWRRRVQFVTTFAAVLAGLIAMSFLLQPGWLGDWLAEVRRYPTYTAVGSPVWGITQYYLGLGNVGEWAVALLLYAVLIRVWYVVIVGRHDERFLWAVMLTLTITHLVAPRTATTHFAVLLAPLMFYVARLARLRQDWAAVGLLLVLIVLPWFHFLSTVQGEFEHPATYLPLPVGTALLLWVTRRQWWSADQL